MKDRSVDDELLARYALGRLSEPDLERVEELILSDRQFFEQLLVVEDDLIDAYAGGRLSEDDRLSFERYLLRNKSDHERVEFARRLAEVLSRDSVVPRVNARPSSLVAWTETLRSRTGMVLAAATVLLALAGSWLVFHTLKLNDRLKQIDAERSAAHERARELEGRIAVELEQNRKLSEELDRERARRVADQTHPESQPPARSFVSLVLNLGAVRGGGSTPKLSIPPDASQVRIHARFKTGSYPAYRAELQTVEGRSLWQQPGLKARARGGEREVSLTAPASLFREDDYVLALKGVTPAGEEQSVGEYFFTVQKK